MFCAECDPKWPVHNLDSEDEVPLNFEKGIQRYTSIISGFTSMVDRKLRFLADSWHIKHIHTHELLASPQSRRPE
jgi:hypothetical protein